MTKSEAREKLQQLYFKALMEGTLDSTSTWDGLSNEPLIDDICKLELFVYDKFLEPSETTNKVPWKKAYQQYLEMKETPLYKLMSESNDS